MKNKGKILVLFLVLLFLAGCDINKGIVVNEPVDDLVVNDGQTGKNDKDNINTEKKDKDIEEENKDNKDNEDNEDNNTNPRDTIDLSVKPNEVGEIMVLMYHNIGEKEDTWVRTPENFRKDLEVLYQKGYRPISLKDFVTNNIDIEAGYTPVVITFDDGNQNNFNILEKDGQKVIDPNCAVGIMEEFHNEHPDFSLEATFFVFGRNPFRQQELIDYKLNYLIEKGFDIGNHTIEHNDFKELGPDGIQRALAENVRFLENIIKDYEINLLALPYGHRPKNKEYEEYLVRGEYNGTQYENIAILNVGWKPSVSPVDKSFNPYSIHRIRASETNVDNVGLYNWLEYFDKNPEKRYISDGNPNVITVPKKFGDKIDKDKIKDKILYLYE